MVEILLSLKGVIASALLTAAKPVFVALIKSVLNPKMILEVVFDLLDALANSTETEWDNKKIEEVKKLAKKDIEKFLEKDSKSS